MLFRSKLGEGLGTFISDEVAAFSVAELGEMLPRILKLESGKQKMDFSFRTYQQANGAWLAVYGAEKLVEIADTEADARAAMMIYLKENKLI